MGSSFSSDLSQGAGTAGNLFLSPFRSIFDLGKAGLSELEGNTDQARADASNAGYAFTNPFRQAYGMKPKHAMTAAEKEAAADKAEQAQQRQQARNWQNYTSSSNTINRMNWGGSSSSNYSYGAGVGNDNVKPSDIMKISDPTAKMLVASTRGQQRTALHHLGASMDIQAAPMLAGNPAMASDNTNSAGGEGHSTQVDEGQDQMKEPNTAPTGASHVSGVDAPSSPTGIENQSAPTPDVNS